MTNSAVQQDVIRFSIPGLAPKSTSPNGRAHYLRKHADGKAYGETVFLIAQSAKPAWWPSQGQERALVTLTQKANRLRDHDNFAASFKPGLDAIVRAGIIADDKPSVIDLSLRAVRVKTRDEECVEVSIAQMRP